MPSNDNSATGAPAFTPLIDTAAAAKLLGLAPISLAKMRVRGDGPPYVQLGRAIRYNPAAVMAWAASHTRRSTSEATVAAARGEAA
ncbi:helix-turn-helix domain-containing protein [Xanthobacter sp. KR7-65]|uniref:helix-turn-helix domain-containing protein n=1 Tax=Xanthobacter sp. KR7-65 TaxID=3156612 RepID=UPI0032B45BCD